MYVCMSRKILSGFASLAASLAQKSRPALRLRLRAAIVEVAGEAPSRRGCRPCRSWNVFDLGVPYVIRRVCSVFPAAQE